MMIDIGVWELFRTLVALMCFTLVPGYVFLTLAFKKTTFEKCLTIPISLGLGLAISVLVSFITEWAGGSLTDYAYVMLIVDIIGLIAATTKAVVKKTITRDSLKISRTTTILAVIVLVWFGVTLRNGPKIGYAHDTWQHVAHIRQALEQDALTPTNALRDDRGLPDFVTRWHTLLAGIARSANGDPMILWYIGNAYVAASAIAVTYALGNVILKRPTLGLLAAVCFLATDNLMYTFVYPWGISYVLMWVSFGIFAEYLKTRNTQHIIVAIIISITMNFLHGMEFIFLCLGVCAFAALSGVAFLQKRRTPQTFARSVIYALLLIVFSFPFSLANYTDRISGQVARLEATTATVDTAASLALYQEPPAQLLYWIFPHRGRLIYFLIEFLPFGAMALPLSLLATDFVDTDGRRLLIVLTWTPVLVYAVPGLSWVTHIVLAEVWSYRLMRLIPTSVVLACAIGWGQLDKLGRSGHESSLKRAIIATIILVSVGYTIAYRLNGPDYHLDPNSLNHTSPLDHYEMYKTLDNASVDSAIVLSDPWTSYTVPALTRHDTVLSEHVGVRRDLYEEMHSLLSTPYQSSSDAISTLEKSGIDYIIINTAWTEDLFRAFQTAFYSDYTLKFLNGNPQCFGSIFADDVFLVYEYTGCKASDLQLKDQILDTQQATAPPEVQTSYDFVDGLQLNGYTVHGGDVVNRGEELQVDLHWHVGKPRAGTYAVWVEVLCDYPGQDHFYGKALRSLTEITSQSSFSASALEWLVAPVSSPEKENTYIQNFNISVPTDMAAGSCDLGVYTTYQRQEQIEKGLLAFAIMEKNHLYRGVQLARLEVR